MADGGWKNADIKCRWQNVNDKMCIKCWWENANDNVLVIKFCWGEIKYDVDFTLGDSWFSIFLSREWNIQVTRKPKRDNPKIIFKSEKIFQISIVFANPYWKVCQI